MTRPLNHNIEGLCPTHTGGDSLIFPRCMQTFLEFFADFSKNILPAVSTLQLCNCKGPPPGGLNSCTVAKLELFLAKSENRSRLKRRGARQITCETVTFHRQAQERKNKKRTARRAATI